MTGREQDYVDQAFATNWLSTVGPHINTLETEFNQLTGCHPVALSSGTAALHLALRAAQVKPADEVVVPTLTFAATANPVLYQGARPVFIDSDRTTWNLDPNLLEAFLAQRANQNRLPKAVIAVHLFGLSADLNAIQTLCRRYGVWLIEDAAESLGATLHGQLTGTLGDAGIFSFNGNKMITGTTGGLFLSRHPQWAEWVRKWSQQARDPDPSGLNNYIHSELGFNYRMSNVVAAIVRGQLTELTQRITQRRAVFQRYADAFATLPGIHPQPEPVGYYHSRWLSCFTIDADQFGLSATGLIRALDAANIEARPVWRPLHTQPLFQYYPRLGGQVAETLNATGISLPSSSCLSPEDQAFVIAAVQRAQTDRPPAAASLA